MANEGEILLTVFLRHQQDKNLGEINARLGELPALDPSAR
jgi:hypothetical protein